MADDVLQPLLARVKTDKGLEVVHRGEPVPDNALEGEAERLTDLGVLGEPFQSVDEVAEAKVQEDRANFEAEVEAAPAAGVPTAAAPTEEIDAFVADATAKEVVAAGEADPDLAPKLVDAEVSVRGDDARTSVLALNES